MAKKVIVKNVYHIEVKPIPEEATFTMLIHGKNNAGSTVITEATFGDWIVPYIGREIKKVIEERRRYIEDMDAQLLLQITKDNG